MTSKSTASASSSARTSSHASRLVELIVCARIPSRSAAAIWLRITASNGETIAPARHRVRAAARWRGVDRRLAPARALDAQHTDAVLHQVAHGLELVGAEGGVGPG